MLRRFLTRRRLKIASYLCLLLAVTINGVAFLHAWAMTHFVISGNRTPSPEQLTVAQKLGVLFTGVRVPRPENRQTPRDFGLDFETVHFTGAKGIALEAWHIRQASAPGIVLMFHGYSASKDSLLPAAKLVHELGYETLLVDFYGSGGSGGNETSIGYHEAADVAAAFAWAQKLPGRPRIILSLLPGRKTLELFPSLGHGSAVRDQSAEWRSRVRTFLDEPLEPAGRKSD